MKALSFKSMGMVVLIALFVTALAMAADQSPLYDNIATPSSADTTTTLTGFGKQLRAFTRSRQNIGFAMQIAGRSSNDSLLCTIQTTNTLNDTSSWVNLTAFGGVKVANGTTVRSYKSGNVQTDSLFFLGRYLRIMVNHGAAAGSSLAGDSSRVNVQITEWDD